MPYATINGRKLHYADTPPSPSETGSDGKPTTAKTPPPATTIIFVHGLGSSQNYFFPILPFLTAYRCVTFDTYGAGRSPYNGDQQKEQHSIETIADDVLGLLDFLGVDKAVVVGYSMGGMVPTVLAARDGKKDGKKGGRVLAAVCIGPVHPGPEVAEVFAKRVATVEEHGMEAMANSIPLAAPSASASPLTRAFIREMLLAQPAAGYIANCRAIESATPPAYADVHVPLLVIAGAEDKSAPEARCRTIFESVGTESERKKMVVLQGVGHWFCVEKPVEVGELVAGWVGGLGL